VSAGVEGEPPLILRLPSLRDEAFRIAELLKVAHEEGHAWSDMAVLCRDYFTMEQCSLAMERTRLPHQKRTSTCPYDPASDTVKIMSMAASKGLEFPVVALPGIGAMPLAGEEEKEEARLFYVAATRATQRLIITVSGEGAFGHRLVMSDATLDGHPESEVQGAPALS